MIIQIKHLYKMLLSNPKNIFNNIKLMDIPIRPPGKQYKKQWKYNL